MNNINGKNNGKDRYWYPKEVIEYIIDDLKKRFPDSIIEREFDLVDIMILGPNLPVEIQRTYSKYNGIPNVSGFENSIRKQIEQNIEIFGQCWFFFDNKFLSYLQNNLGRNASINFDWFYQFFKSGKLRVFSITIDGAIKELDEKDFGFIKNFSSTCRLSKEEEHRVLERNKSKIAYNVYRGHGFSTDDIKRWHDEYINDDTRKEKHFFGWLEQKGDRRKELGNIKRALGNIPFINEMLKCNMKDKDARYASALGIISGNENMYSRNIRCSDDNNILEYFPGYFANRELWDYWRIHVVDNRTFNSVVRGEYPNYLKDRKNQKNIEDAWG